MTAAVRIDLRPGARQKEEIMGGLAKTSGAIGGCIFGSALLFAATAAAQDGAALFSSLCAGCHNDVNHPKGLVYNAAGNVAIIEAVIAKGMDGRGSLADHTSVAAYLDSVKPTINMRPVAHDSAGTRLVLGDIIVSGAQLHESWKIITNIVTVSPPTKGTVTYQFANGFAVPSYVTYTPFPGQSGVDSWTYQGTGPEAATTVRSASVNIANADGTPSTPPDLNQHGLTGSYYEPATDGQGIEVEVFADYPGQGKAFAFASWFTYDSVAGGAERQRWYTMGGSFESGASKIALTIYQNTGGNFNAAPTTTAQPVGSASLAFDSCAGGQLDYSFTDGSGRSGTIPLTRLTQNVTCSTTSARPTNVDFALSGNWYDAATSGQGVTVEVNPASGVLFLAWYTYAPNGAGLAAGGQRWYTAQGPFTAGARSVALTLYETTGGLFDTPSSPPAKTVAIGTGTLSFQSCSSATLTFAFTNGTSSGKSGSIALTRVGPVPSGCAS